MGLKIEAGKQYVTRDGKRVRVFATDGGGVAPCLGAYQSGRGVWYPMSWTEGGWVVRSGGQHVLDIVAEYDWRQEIPWDHIHPDIKWIARDKREDFFRGYSHAPGSPHSGSGNKWTAQKGHILAASLRAVAGMPKGPQNWLDSLAKRP